MTINPIRKVLDRIRGTLLMQEEKEQSDGQLLERFVAGGDKLALEMLVRRHAPMVLGVCRRLLRNTHDADDAFQATFLVLVRRAASIRSPELLANWLYRVARKTACKARQIAVKRGLHVTQPVVMPEPPTKPHDDMFGPEELALLDMEVERLPEKYRLAIVLCELEGKSHRDVAQQLHVKEGTVGSRLTRGHAMLAQRLARRGVTMSATSVAAVLTEQAASGTVPAALLDNTIQATTLLAAGDTVTAGLLSPKVSPLTEDVLRAITGAKRKAASVVLLMAALVMGGGAVAYHTLAGQSSQLVEPPKVSAEDSPLGMKFVRLPKGTFYMGWDDHNKGKKTEIKEDFEIAIHTVTQGQWQEVMGTNPSWFSRDNGWKDKDIQDEDLKQFPVEMVSWLDAQEFIKKLNEKEKGRGYLYRLPSEAEWEYACRGGSTSEEECSYHFYFDKPTNDLSSKQANFNFRIREGTRKQFPGRMIARKGQTMPPVERDAHRYLNRPTKVGSYEPNKLGLYDMQGNVSQWCEDLWLAGASDRVFRGGCWRDRDQDCRAAIRHYNPPDFRHFTLGFRLARVPVR